MVFNIRPILEVGRFLVQHIVYLIQIEGCRSSTIVVIPVYVQYLRKTPEACKNEWNFF